jgi:ABC-type phosphate transport system substrate-binding protein
MINPTFICSRPGRAVALALSTVALTTSRVQADPVTLVETGSTLLYPLINIWVANYTKTHPGVSITTDATGSEAGIKKIISGEAASLKNESGNFVLPTKEAVEAAAAGLGASTPPNKRLTIVLAPGAATYPIVNYEYAIVSAKQADKATATALRKFLLWSIVPVKRTRVISIVSISSHCRLISGS